MKDILITGGAGYIGSQIAFDLIDKGYKISIIDNLSSGNKKLIPKKANFVKCDITNLKKINTIFKKSNIDCVIHCAASISVEESIKKPKKYHSNNYLKTRKFINFCIKKKIKRYIFSSTAAVYKQSEKLKIKEKHHKNPNNPYGQSKLNCENFLLKKKDIQLFILRYFNVAGADDRLRTGPINDLKTSHLIKRIVQIYFKERDELEIYGKNYKTLDGTAIRDFIHIKDLSYIHQNCLNFFKKKKRNFKYILNCGYGIGYSVLEVVKAAKKIFNIKYKFSPQRPGDCSQLISNNNKVKKLFNMKLKKKSLKIMIKSSINWEKHFRKKSN